MFHREHRQSFASTRFNFSLQPSDEERKRNKQIHSYLYFRKWILQWSNRNSTFITEPFSWTSTMGTILPTSYFIKKRRISNLHSFEWIIEIMKILIKRTIYYGWFPHCYNEFIKQLSTSYLTNYQSIFLLRRTTLKEKNTSFEKGKYHPDVSVYSLPIFKRHKANSFINL